MLSKKENHLWVNWHLQNNATKDRTYPKINEGDVVRVNINNNKFAKGYEPTKTKPLDAVKKRNHLWVNLHLQNNATEYRTYPKINEGDMVRVNINKHKFAKGYEPNWSRERYIVVGIKGNQYLIPGINEDKLYLRHELLKV